MPLPCYLTIKGAKQGKIEGSCEVAGHIGEIEIQAVEHTVEIPRNPQTGQPTGQRVHGVIKLTKVLDKASPKILQALVTGEPLEEVKLAFYRFNQKSGTTEKYYTITLKDATVATGHLSVSNCLLESNKALGHMEDISFAYGTIIWSADMDSVESQDSWKGTAA